MELKNSQINTTHNTKNQQRIQKFWNFNVMERFINANLFMVCCFSAGLLLIVYLGAFSCEVAWLLEAHGDLPFGAYYLCTHYFIVFVATTILIHGLVTGMSWGLFAWSIAIGLLSIPELVFVMIMTTQHWGLQSVHGLVELISYLGRLVINCLALICVIPTGIRWRRETQVLSQLQDLARRLQLQTPPPSAPDNQVDGRLVNKTLSQTAFENTAFDLGNEPLKLSFNNDNFAHTQELQNFQLKNKNKSAFGSQNEFNASLFTPSAYLQYKNANMIIRRNRTQSLMDLRCTLPGMYNPRHALESEDKNVKYFNISIDDLKQNLQNSPLSANNAASTCTVDSSATDPIYCSIEPMATPPPQRHTRYEDMRQSWRNSASPPKKLTRNCISLQNLEDISKVQMELETNAILRQNLLQNLTQQQQYYLALLAGQYNPFLYRQPGMLRQPMPIMQPRNSQQMQYFSGFGYTNYTNPYITANSKLSLSNESDDYRKYRDVAL